jgi:DNA-binding CsgD family transcriptional regulator
LQNGRHGAPPDFVCWTPSSATALRRTRGEPAIARHPREVRTASQITEGKSIEQISSATSIAQNTIRTHLKSVFQKTAVQRQAELVSLLGVAINHVV